MDSHRGTLGPILDESAWLRPLQRRNIDEELVASEEGYIADVEILINVCHWNQYALETLSGACHDTTFRSFRGLDAFTNEFWGDRTWLEETVFFDVAGEYRTQSLKVKSVV
jgi:hypothetical protein